MGFEAFARIEGDNWSRASLASHYVSLFACAADQAIPSLIDAIRPTGGLKALDLCCGQGNVTGALKASGADAVGLDFSPAMLALAQARVPNTKFVLGDVQALPFSDAEFDVAVSGFGICHVPDQERALTEAYRVLRSDGRFALTVWCGPDQSACFDILYGAIREHGDSDVTLPPGPDFHQFASKRLAGDLLAAAGFSDVEVEIVDCYWALSHPDELCQIFEKATARASVLLAAQPPSYLEAIRDAVASRVSEQFAIGKGYRVPVPAALVTARR